MAEQITVARPYAEAVFALARERNALPVWAEMLRRARAHRPRRRSRASAFGGGEGIAFLVDLRREARCRWQELHPRADRGRAHRPVAGDPAALRRSEGRHGWRSAGADNERLSDR